MQIVQNSNATVTTTSLEVLPQRDTRTGYVLTNLSATETAYITRGTTTALTSKGIVLPPGASWSENDDAAYRCWRGPVQVIGTAALTLAISESQEVS